MLCLAWGIPQGENGKLTISGMILQILVFFLTLPATTDFSVSSDSCFMNLSRFYSYIKWERQGGLCLVCLAFLELRVCCFSPEIQLLNISQHTAG